MSVAGGTRKRILVAEDDAVFRRVISFTLDRAGFEVLAVPDGQVALRVLEQEDFDCLISDHQMPIMSGVELLGQVRAIERLRNLPAILCTAKGLELDTNFLIQRFNLAAVMHKPFSPRRLVELLEQSCNSASEV